MTPLDYNTKMQLYENQSKLSEKIKFNEFLIS